MEIIKIVCAVLVVVFGLVYLCVDFMQKKDELDGVFFYFIKRILLITVLAILVYFLM